VSVRNHSTVNLQPSEHTARFFDTEESRAKSVAAFLAEGYRRDEFLVVIMRLRLWVEVQTELRALGVPVDAAIAGKRLIVRDAVETLKKISNHDGPSAALFDNVIGACVRSAGSGGVVRAYGAMVDILAQQSEFDLALRLEELWNRLARQVSLNLMCGYSSAHFVSAGTHEPLCALCAKHDRVDMHAHDQLGAWLLENAGIQTAAT
jgi:hypothetical protein